MTSNEVQKLIRKIETLALELNNSFLASDADAIIEIVSDLGDDVERLAIEYGKPEPTLSTYYDRHGNAVKVATPRKSLDVKAQALEDLKRARDRETTEYWGRKGVIR